jgi:hypothetical protein
VCVCGGGGVEMLAVFFVCQFLTAGWCQSLRSHAEDLAGAVEQDERGSMHMGLRTSICTAAAVELDGCVGVLLRNSLHTWGFKKGCQWSAPWSHMVGSLVRYTLVGGSSNRLQSTVLWVESLLCKAASKLPVPPAPLSCVAETTV